jgi:dihydrolipoamide dehydrogenase
MVERQPADVIVLGAGPGGYAAAFYAADRGRKVLLVEQEARLGGVCLTKGCIPSKALLHATDVMREVHELSAGRGIAFGAPKVHLEKLRAWKEGIVDKLAQGVAGAAARRGISVLRGRGYFEDSTTLRVETDKGQQFVQFARAIIAVGSKPALPKAFDLGNKRIMTSTEALELEEVPKHLLIVGGGYIGLELGTVYATLGSRSTLI